MVTVLIADDSLYIREIIRDLVVEAGHNVVGEASNPNEALEQYMRLKPDVLFLDIIMEKGLSTKTGLDTLREVRAFDPNANVIICSALEEQDIIQQAMMMGAKAFLVKPFEPEKLLDALKSCTDTFIISEIGNIAAGNAATALSKLAGTQIQIGLPNLQTVPGYLAGKLYGNPDREVTAIYMPTNTKPSCDFVFVFEHGDAEKVVQMMTQSCGRVDNPEIFRSALEEMGSILGCSFVSAIANFAGVKIVPCRPEVVCDSWAASVDVFLCKQMIEPKSAIILQIELSESKGSLRGYVLMFPSDDFQEEIINAGKKML
jgi:two-component system chemotaxis response regulator CheY